MFLNGSPFALKAERHVGTDCDLEALFTEDELRENSAAVRKLNAEYAALNRLDRMDVAISAFAALTSAAIDILLVGIPKKGARRIVGWDALKLYPGLF